MPLPNYGLLTGALTSHGPQHGGNPHYLLMIKAGVVEYRVAINLQSTLPQGDDPAALQYQILTDLAGSALARRITNKSAFFLAGSDPDIPTLDFVRGGFLKMSNFLDLKVGLSPNRNPLYSRLQSEADDMLKNGGFVAVFGTGYPDQDDRPPGGGHNPRRASMGFSGVDNIHMNQGSFLRVENHLDNHYKENGPNQDGAVLFFRGDGAVVGVFTKFTSQDSATDQFGNPVHTGVKELDSSDVITASVRKKLTANTPRMAAFVGGGAKPVAPGKASKLAAAALRGRGRAMPPADPTTEIPIGGTSGGNLAGGFIFNDPRPIDDPNKPFEDDDDSQFRNSPFVKQFASQGVPEPVPGPRNGVYPRMALNSVLNAQAIAAITQSGQIVFHVDGDTGAPEQSKLQDEVSVAQLMLQDFAPGVAVADRPAFYFHVGDVVYYYGEPEYYYEEFYKPYESYPAPIFAIPGNHDGITYQKDMVSLEGFINAFCDDQPRHWSYAGGLLRTTMTQPGVYFTLDCPFVSIIGLYSNCSESFGYIDDQQKLFFYNELKRLKPLRDNGTISAILLAVHHSPLSFSAAKPASSELRDSINTACDQAGTWPDAVFSGHAHIYQRMTRTVKVGGSNWQVPHIISGSGGYTVSPKQEVDKPDMDLLDSSDPQFLLHRFLPNFGYLRVTVNRENATLRVDFCSPEISDGRPADVCLLDLKNHALLVS